MSLLMQRLVTSYGFCADVTISLQEVRKHDDVTGSAFPVAPSPFSLFNFLLLCQFYGQDAGAAAFHTPALQIL